MTVKLTINSTSSVIFKDATTTAKCVGVPLSVTGDQNFQLSLHSLFVPQPKEPHSSTVDCDTRKERLLSYSVIPLRHFQGLVF